MTLTGAERASAAMCRVLDIAARVIRGLTILAIASVAAIAIAWVAWGGANAACGDHYSVHAREQGIWTTLRSRARPVRGNCRVPGPLSHGSSALRS